MELALPHSFLGHVTLEMKIQKIHSEIEVRQGVRIPQHTHRIRIFTICKLVFLLLVKNWKNSGESPPPPFSKTLLPACIYMYFRAFYSLHLHSLLQKIKINTCTDIIKKSFCIKSYSSKILFAFLKFLQNEFKIILKLNSVPVL